MAAGEMLVAGPPGEAVGVVVMVAPGTPGMAVARAEEAELCLLAVSAQARREGIGHALVERCTELAGEKGWRAIALWSRPYQTAAPPPLRIARLPAPARARRDRRERLRPARLPPPLNCINFSSAGWTS